eukprot:6194133-Pleurochrysis_carterae.AAC.1
MAGKHQRSGEGQMQVCLSLRLVECQGGSEVQRTAQRQKYAFRLMKMIDVEGKCFYNEFVVPWLTKAWSLVQNRNPSAAREQLKQVPPSLRLGGSHQHHKDNSCPEQPIATAH